MQSRSPLAKKNLFILSAAVAGVTGLAGSAHALVKTWDGGSLSTDNWSDGANWIGDVAFVSNDSAVFEGSTRLTPQQNLTNPAVLGITFNAGAGAFTLGGNSINLNGDVINNSTSIQTINMNQTIASTRTYSALSGDLVIGGVINDAALSIIVRTPAGSPTINGLVTLTNNNTFDGGVVINVNGKLAAGHDNALGTGALSLAGGTFQGATAARTLTNVVSLTADSTIAGSIGLTFNGKLSNASTQDRILNVNNSALTQFSGGVDLNSGIQSNRKLTIQGSGNVTVNSLIANGASATAGNLTYNGTATLSLTSANTYTGVTAISNGVISVTSLGNGGSASGIGNSTNAAANLIIGSATTAGTLRYTGSAVASTDRGFTVGIGGAILDASGTPVDVVNTGVLNWSPAVNMAFTPSVNTLRSLTFTGTNTGANTYSGNITNAGGGTAGGVVSVVKNGVGTWNLNAAASVYTGTTSVNEGTLYVNGKHTGAGDYAVAAGATLGGNGDGTTTGLISLASTKSMTFNSSGSTLSNLAPGNSVGKLTVATVTAGGNVNLAGANYAWEIGSLTDAGVGGTTGAGTNFDQLVVNGAGTTTLTLGGLSQISILFVGVADPNSADPFWTSDHTWKIVDVSGTTTTSGVFSGIANASFDNGNFSTSIGTGGDAGDVFLNYQAAAIPEPSVLSLVGMGAVGLAGRRRRR